MLVLHAAAGSLALVVGPAALAGVRRAVVPYRVLVLVVAATAMALTWSSTLPGAVRGLLALVAVGSAVGVLVPSVRGLRSSYVALVAALAFVSAPVWVGVAVVAVGSAVVHGVPVREAVRGGGWTRGPQRRPRRGLRPLGARRRRRAARGGDQRQRGVRLPRR